MIPWCMVRCASTTKNHVRCVVSSPIEIDVELFVRICAILYGTCAMNDFTDISPYPFWLDKPSLLSCCNVLYSDLEKKN